ncbi:FAD binding domain-containing protein [Neobacillus jeddahensis]|uniref:FAD binding domain-containing protein n=1 Tax=Neobacillus jeddahensis TaxID=1461580 RepID=UPI000B15188D|nr:FAD binding domain-containing protein [Neobacillus jeddahensis]
MIRQGATMLHSPTVWLPDELVAAWEFKQTYGSEASFIAGGTLLQTNWVKNHAFPPHLISLAGIKALHGVGKELVHGETVIRIGASTTLQACRKESLLVQQAPLLEEAIRTIAAPAIRNRATVGGNVGGRFGDIIPALLAMDASLALFDGTDTRLVALSDWIKDSEPDRDSILVYVTIPEKSSARKEAYFYRKIGYRDAFSPSIVTISGYCYVNEEKKIEEIRLAVSGGTTQPQRLIKSEQKLISSCLTTEKKAIAFQSITAEFAAATDSFTTAEYKKTVAANLIISELMRLAG